MRMREFCEKVMNIEAYVQLRVQVHQFHKHMEFEYEYIALVMEISTPCLELLEHQRKMVRKLRKPTLHVTCGVALSRPLKRSSILKAAAINTCIIFAIILLPGDHQAANGRLLLVFTIFP